MGVLDNRFLEEPNGKHDPVKIAGFLLGPAAFFFLLLMPPPESLPETGRAMMATGALMTIWWLTEAIPIPATSLLPIGLFPILNIMPVQEAASPYSNHLVYLFLGGFMLALGIERVGLHRRIALLVINYLGSSLTRLVMGFMIATAFISMWISNTATTLMMLPIALAVTREVSLFQDANGHEKEDEMITRNFGLALMLGIAYASSIGGISTLIGTPPNIVFAGLVRKLYPAAPEIAFFQWMIFALPLVIIFLPVVWFILTRITPAVSLSKLKFSRGLGKTYLRKEIYALGAISAAEKRVVIIFLLTAFSWIFRAPLEIGSFRIPGLTDIIPNLADSTIAMILGISMFLVPTGARKAEFILDWETVQKGVPWGILLLFGGGFALADGLEKSGITFYLGRELASLQGIPVFIMILLVCALLTFLTELTSNTATATILVPVMGAAAVSLGQHPFLFMIPATINASFAFMLPVATPPNAIVFSSTWITIRQMARAGLLLNIIGILLVSSFMYLLGHELFGIDIGVLPEWAK